MHLRSRGLLLVGTLFAWSAALAHSGNSEIDRWYQSLRVPGSGEGCCSVADCHPTDARLVTNGWEVFVEGSWRPVPEALILTRENMDGRPVVCLYYGVIRCFVPPARS
jgi:hypothetical protein